MSVADNKEIIRHWFSEVVNGRTDKETFLAGLNHTVSPHFIDHDMPVPEHGYGHLQTMLPRFFKAFPDLRFTVQHLIGECDYVAVRLKGEATVAVEFLGRPGNGEKLNWTETEIYHMEEGKILESWGEGTLEAALASVGIRMGV